MAEKAVAMLCILLLGFCLADYSSAQGGALVEDTNGHKSFDTTPLSSSSDDDVVLGNKLVVTIVVMLINGDGEDPAQIYGEITARIGDSPHEISLFKMPSSDGDYFSVRPGERIKLANSVLGMTLDSNLTIRADLWDYDRLSHNDEIAKGSAHFQPKRSGSSTLNIKGRYGEIKVKIFWHPIRVVDDSKISETTADQ